MDMGRVNLDACLSLLDGLVGAGLERLVYSPGSRNTPLTLAALLHVQVCESAAVDERSAAWQALGMARVTGLPVALVCTSGTAVANWHPAVVEADRQGIPLVLISADRPWELRDCNANQSIDQLGLFGRHVRSFHQLSPPDASPENCRRLQALGRQLARECLGPATGPVHLNFPFREPLVPADLPETITGVQRDPFRPGALCLGSGELRTLVRKLGEGRGLIVCGPGSPLPDVLDLGEVCAAPVLADPLSGLRFLPTPKAAPLVAYDLFLRNEDLQQSLRPDWILHLGGLPVSKSLQNWLSSQSQAGYWWVTDSGGSLDLPGRSVETLPASPEGLVVALQQELQPRRPGPWLQGWRQREQEALGKLDQADLPLEMQLQRILLRQLPDDSLLFLSNSLPVRFLDAGSGSLEKAIAVYGNRGASGIDGNLSTLAGLVAAWQGNGVAVGILGDLAFFHDLNALSLCRQQDLLLLLFNNGGGGIFGFLPQQKLPMHEAGWRTPVPLDYKSLAKAFGIGYCQLGKPGDIESVLTESLAKNGCRLVEIVIDAEASRQQYQQLINQFVEPA
jgi:2-succinyl-5-enolpyruvyl-6-hydroxy-3-cyclohexene-1-carboxylate synthase